jgi:hypothetical protein
MRNNAVDSFPVPEIPKQRKEKRRRKSRSERRLQHKDDPSYAKRLSLRKQIQKLRKMATSSTDTRLEDLQKQLRELPPPPSSGSSVQDSSRSRETSRTARRATRQEARPFTFPGKYRPASMVEPATGSRRGGSHALTRRPRPPSRS